MIVEWGTIATHLGAVILGAGAYALLEWYFVPDDFYFDEDEGEL